MTFAVPQMANQNPVNKPAEHILNRFPIEIEQIEQIKAVPHNPADNREEANKTMFPLR